MSIVDRYDEESLLGHHVVGKKLSVPLTLEIFLHIGLLAVATGLLMVASVSDPERISKQTAVVIFSVYYCGSLLVSSCGFLVVFHLRKHNEFIWFMCVYVGTLLSMWNTIIDSWLESKNHFIYFILTGLGCISICTGMSQITVYRHMKYRWIVKGLLIMGIVLCHVVSMVDAYGYRMILLSIGVGVVTVTGVIARILLHLLHAAES